MVTTTAAMAATAEAMAEAATKINRNTVANVRAAGFQVDTVTNIFLDVIKTIEATAPVK